MNKVLRTLYATGLAGGLVLSNIGGDSVIAGQRGKSGLPPGPGNPIAAVYSQVKSLQTQIQSLLNQIQGVAGQTTVMWINHLDFVPGGAEVDTLFDSTNSGVGGGLSGLIIVSSTTGDTFSTGGNKVVEKGLQVPPNYKITGVRVCYENSNPASFITQTRLAQLQDPSSTALVMLDDETDLNAVGPVCADSAVTSIDPSAGAVRLSFRANFANTTDRIVVRGVGLHLERTGL